MQVREFLFTCVFYALAEDCLCVVVVCIRRLPVFLYNIFYKFQKKFGQKVCINPLPKVFFHMLSAHYRLFSPVRVLCSSHKRMTGSVPSEVNPDIYTRDMLFICTLHKSIWIICKFNVDRALCSFPFP